jgi:hypothetical protein
MDITIKINVEGQIFQTRKETLLKIPYFENLFQDAAPKTEDIIFIDRSARGFSHILQWARNPEYKIPSKYKLELDFFLIEYQPSNLSDVFLDIKSHVNDRISIFVDLNYDLECKLKTLQQDIKYIKSMVGEKKCHK